jgi:hypothetical protein
MTVITYKTMNLTREPTVGRLKVQIYLNQANRRSYYSYGTDDPKVFPFHDSCLEVFCRTLFGHEDVRQIDNDILFSAMSQLDGWRALEVDYGGILGKEQFWDCLPGEEVCSLL